MKTIPDSDEPVDKHQRKLDMAARAAWLYYVANNTQDEIAAKLHLSRQAAQRLVSLAASEGLIKVRLDHPLAECAELAEKLRERYKLSYCDVAPSSGSSSALFKGLGICAAEYLESYLSSKVPTICAFGTGRTMRAMVSEVAPMHQSQHKIVSVVGNMGHDGRASHFEVVMLLADKINAQAFLLPTPVLTSTVQEKINLQKLKAFHSVRSLALQAKAVFVGASEIGRNCPMYQDGFINDAELSELLKQKAVGEIIGWTFDKDGKLLEGAANERVASIPLSQLGKSEIVAIAGGPSKVRPILGALRGRLITALVTDEMTAREILAV
ncbi:MAG: sugar-binding transcriptional regulator [Terracidiphilus sp.]